jgi:hypothetical protein
LLCELGTKQQQQGRFFVCPSLLFLANFESTLADSLDVGEQDVLEDLVEQGLGEPGELEVHVHGPGEEAFLGVAGRGRLDFDTTRTTVSPGTI